MTSLGVEEGELAGHGVQHPWHVGRPARGRDAEKPAVGVGVVESHAVLHPAVLVQHVGVQAGVHAFAGTAGGEGAAASEQRLQGCEGVDVGVGDGEGFEGEVDVGHAGGRGLVGWGGVGVLGSRRCSVMGHRSRWVGRGGGVLCGLGSRGETVALCWEEVERFLRKGILDIKRESFCAVGFCDGGIGRLDLLLVVGEQLSLPRLTGFALMS